MQGVQMFTGVDDAWGGFAGRYTERIRDDFGKVGLWVWGVEAGGGEERRVSFSLLDSGRGSLRGWRGESSDGNWCLFVWLTRMLRW